MAGKKRVEELKLNSEQQERLIELFQKNLTFGMFKHLHIPRRRVGKKPLGQLLKN